MSVQLLFEKSMPGRGTAYLPQKSAKTMLPANLVRGEKPRLPEIGEAELARHYSALERRTFGVNNGFYPLGSCTMKYNPRLNEEAAALPGFTGIHPLQPAHTVQGCLDVLQEAEGMLNELTGMDGMTFLPAAGAHGEWTGLLMIQAYHRARGDKGRTKILIPDSAHGTNPASATMCGYAVTTIPSDKNGCVDIDALRAAAGPDTAGLMLTNPNTLGLFDPNILEITRIVHEADGLCYYDGANLNAIMGVTRPGDMGFDVIHLNLHKTFSTPHGGGGPGSGPTGCKAALLPYLPQGPDSIGRIKMFHGNFLVVVRALAYLYSLGGDGLAEASRHAVLNANYLMHRLRDIFSPAYDTPCMHEFVCSLAELKRDAGVSAMDVAKAMIDEGMHPPTMYFPLIVPEALMFEPTETETRETLDRAADTLRAIYARALADPQSLRDAPVRTPIGRPDEVSAARSPRLRG
ncbi:MAG: aminomethyl-transferring glycine dehydrogenase subunit GcvPB [Clostridia bacterium]|nr:aminomethyl-transferring glycine dehydrogenase subunit GcvPB [Clostridia bacterium]